MLLQLLTPRAALVNTSVHPILRHQSQMASLFGYTGVAEPEFEVLKKGAGYEVRKYGPQIRALTQQTQGKGNGPAFRTLAGYIFGGNTAKGSDKCEKIAMTAPVAMSMPNKGESIAMTAPVSMQGETMSFVMPAKYKSIDELPIPKSADVKLIEVPSAQYAVIRFSGLLSEGQITKHEAKLREAATKDGLALSTNPGDVQVWGFNPPWTLPFARRNEVAIPLATPL